MSSKVQPKDFSIDLFLNKNRIKNNGKYPVMLKVYLKKIRQRKYFPTDFELTEEDFNAILNLSEKGISKKLKEIRNQLINLHAAANEIADGLSYFSFEVFEKEIQKGTISAEKNLAWHYQDYIDTLIARRCIRTAENYRLSLMSISKFNGNKVPDFLIINPDWLKRYELWMVDNGKSLTTVSIYLRNLRAIYNRAKEDKTIPEDLYPFGKRKYIIPEPSAAKKTLKKEELKLLLYGKPNNEFQQKAKDFWFFSFSGNGMNIKDIAYLRLRDIDGDRIVFHRKKTSTTNSKQIPVKVYLNDFIREILEKYGNKTGLPDDHVFSIVNKYDSPEEQLKMLKNFIRFIGQHMDLYAKSLGIQTSVNVKISRHSFATTSILKGQSMEFAQEALGHSNIRTTQAYFSGFEDETKKEFAQKLMDF